LEKVFFQNCLKYHLLKLEKMSGKRPRVMLANSQTVAERIEYFYHRHANVIYPPVESPPQKIQKYRHKTKYYFYCGRLVRQKFVNLAIQACKKLNKTLIVAGDGDALTDLKRISDKNIIFTGRVSERKKWSLLKGAEAFIFPTPDEDFGIAPVEALMVGTPVIAFKSGGPSETLVDGQTGVFFHPFSVSGLIEGIKKFESLKFSRRLCRLRAQKYSRIKFEKKLKKVVYGALNAQQLRKIP
jgi:glycosyltransferase involved in cell wall biosynthesis